MQKELIVIAGPTASGKTGLAVQLAQKLGTEILSADSRQCFREMRIGVARPSEEEMEAVPHHFIGSHSIHETVNAGTFEQYGLAVLEKIFSHHSTAIVVGGTGLYIKALCEGLDQIPPVDKSIREKITRQYLAKGITWLQEEVRQKDPLYWQHTTEKENPQRLMRALEVQEGTGSSIVSFRTHLPLLRDFHIRKYAIEWPREILYERINQRVDLMMEAGLLEEVKSLSADRHLNALQTVGYTELWDYLDGKTTLREAVEKIKTHTRHYAKRQMTWFKKDPGILWVPGAGIATFIQQFQP